MSLPARSGPGAIHGEPALSSTHALLLIVALGLLVTAGVLESLLPRHDAADAVEEYHVPAIVHAFAVASAMLSLSPATRRIWLAAKVRRVSWHVVIVAGVGVAFGAGQVMAGTVAALVCSVAFLTWRRFDRTG